MELEKIITTLMRVETKGENTLIMADCIRALAVFSEEVKNMSKELEELRKEKEDNSETIHDTE